MRLRRLFSSSAQPPALQIPGFQVLKNTAGDTVGSVLTSTINLALPQGLASTLLKTAVIMALF